MKPGRHLLLLLLALCLSRDYQADAKPAAPNKAVRTDLYGDPLPEGALARLGTIYLRTDFQAIAFRADGRDFYSWNQAGLLRVHDGATGMVVRSFRLTDSLVSRAQFSADGRFLTLGVDCGVGDARATALTVWHSATGKLVREIDPYVGERFSSWDASLHDGRIVLTCDSYYGPVRVWDLRRGSNRLLREKSEEAKLLCCSPDGKRLFVQKGDSVECWDTTNGKQLWNRPIKGADARVAPDGKALLVCETDTTGARLHMIATDTGKEQPGLKLPAQWRGSPPAWHADGRTLLVPDGGDHVVRIWDLVTGKERGRLSYSGGPIAVSADGKSLLGDDRGLQRWDLKTLKPLFPSTAGRGHRKPVTAIACSPDSNLFVSADSEGNICFWDLRTNRLIRVMDRMKCAALAFTSDNKRLLVGATDKRLLVCDPISGKVVKRWKLEGLPADCSGFGMMTALHRNPFFDRCFCAGALPAQNPTSHLNE